MEEVIKLYKENQKRMGNLGKKLAIKLLTFLKLYP